MSTINQDRFYQDSRVKNLEEERKEENQRNDTIVEKLIGEIQKKSPQLAIPTMVTKIAAKHNSEVAKKATEGFSPEQMKQLEQINSNSGTIGNSLESIPYAKYLGEIAGALGIVQQIAGAKSKAKESAEISDNLTKSIYHLQNGGKLKDVSGALLAGNTKSAMGAMGTITAGSWLHDMATTGQISNLTGGTMALSNPAMLASGMAGGIAGLGNITGSVMSTGLNGLGGITGLEAFGKGAKALSTLDPTMATALGMGAMVGISIGANKLLNNAIKNSPLATGTKKEKRWNIRQPSLKATDNPIALANYSQSNNILKQLQNQNILSPAETQMISKLNEIAFYTSTIHDLYDVMANKGVGYGNSTSRSLNKIDEDQITKDMNGTELKNLFKDGKLTSGQITFLRSMEGIKSLTDVFNPGTYLRSLAGKNTAPQQFKLRDAINGADPMAAKKEMAKKFNITIADVDLLHADIKARIGDADESFEGRLLASGIYTNLFLQMIASKMIESNGKGGKSGLIGELARLQEIQDLKNRENYSMLIDGMIKPIMEKLANTRGLSSLVPLINSAAFLSKTGTQAISGLSKFIINPKKGLSNLVSGAKDIWNNSKDSFIDSLKPDSIKNENTIRSQIGANALSLQDKANYAILTLPEHMQKIQWLLGSTEKAKVQDKYTGEYVDSKTLKNRYKNMKNRILDMTKEEEEVDSYFQELKNWSLKKLYGVKEKDIKDSSFKNYSHVGDLLKELDGSNIEQQKQNNSLQFRMKSRRNNSYFFNNASNSIPTNQLDINIQKIKNINIGLENQYYQMMNKYIPMLEEIRDCVCKECDCVNNRNIPGNKTLSKIFNRKTYSLDNYIDNPNDQTLLTGNKKQKPKGFMNLLKPMEYSKEKILAEDNISKFFSVYYKNMPYLEKIYKHLTKTEIKSGYVKTETKNDGVGSLLSGIGSLILDGLLDVMGLGDGKSGKKLLKGGSRVLSGMAGGLSRALFSLAGVLAKPGPAAVAAAIAGIAGVGIDYFFNDGKGMRQMWDSLKESSFGQGISGMWDKATEFYDKILEFFSNFANFLSNGLNGLSEFGKKVKDNYNSVTSSLGFGTQSESDIRKDLDLKNTDIDKVNYLNKLKTDQKISTVTYNNLIGSIKDKQIDTDTKKWGISLGSGITNKNYLDKNIAGMSPEKLADFMSDANYSYKLRKSIEGNLGAEEEKSFQEVNKRIQDNLKEKFKDNRSLQEQEDQKKALDLTLSKIDEISLNNAQAMQNLLNQNSRIGLQSSKNLGDQIAALSDAQAGIVNMLNITAKSIQKPSIIELDPKVINILPILKG